MIKLTIEAQSLEEAKAKFERFFNGPNKVPSSSGAVVPAAAEPSQATSEEKPPLQEAPLKKARVRPKKDLVTLSEPKTPDEEEKVPDISEMREAVQNVINKHGIASAQQIIMAFGVHKYSAIHESDRRKFVEKCEEALA